MSEEFKDLISQPEKRHYQRLDISLNVQVEIDGQKIQATTQNISCGGMFLPDVNMDLTAELVDSKVLTFINLPDHAEAIRVPAKIRRVERCLESKKIGVAFEFNRLYDDNRLQIDRFVKWKLLN